MEETIIELFKIKQMQALPYKDIIEELDLTEKQQLVLLSKFKSFKNIEKTYMYDDKKQLITIVRLKNMG
ncbi:hypothetical protein NGF69_16310 [Enterococcus casseliflavus]|nr:hypothetical protein [Enterococcus casseliflavus]